MAQTFLIRARWDDESGTWWTDGEDVPGLCCEAASFEELVEAVFALAPDVLIANGIVAAEAGEVTLVVTAERRGSATLVA